MTEYRNIPPELRQLKQWACSRIGPRKKGDIGPIGPLQVDGTNASSTNPATWNFFDVCVEAAAMNGWGVAFCFTEHDPYAVIDLDHVRDKVTTITEAWALGIVVELNSYAELSWSGTGWHIVVRGRLTGSGNKVGRVEMYDTAKFVTLTGWKGEGQVREVDLGALQARMLAGSLEPKNAAAASPVHRTGQRVTGGSESEEDIRLIGKIKRALHTRDAHTIEVEFARLFPDRYRAQNLKHGGRHGGKTYIRYSIERMLQR